MTGAQGRKEHLGSYTCKLGWPIVENRLFQPFQVVILDTSDQSFSKSGDAGVEVHHLLNFYLFLKKK